MITLGLAGFGVVGSGFARVLEENREIIRRRLGKELRIKTVLARDMAKPRVPPPGARFTDRPEDLLTDPEIDIVVELMGGLNAAESLVRSALLAGKHVVTANKALLAERGQPLFDLAAERGLGLYYEASAAGGVPIVQTLKESLAGNRILKVMGILNGTCNYILSEMTQKGMDFAEALADAQRLGYAEAHPGLDVDGGDAAHKLALLIRLAFGVNYPFPALPVSGVRDVTAMDIDYARELGYRIKLIGYAKAVGGQPDESAGGCAAGRIEAGVFPALLKESYLLAKVDSNYNAVRVEANASGPIMLYGQGAGGLPTGSAVMADVMALARGCAPNNTGFSDASLPPANILPPELSKAPRYFRFTVADRPGVLAEVARALADRNISIAQAIQRGAAGENDTPIVFITHEAQEASVHNALKEIDSFSFITAKTVHFRIF